MRAAVGLAAGRGALTGAVGTIARAIDAAFLEACVHNQAKRVQDELVERSAVVRETVENRQVDIVAAAYDLRSGKVNQIQ